jgi:hypothetical protein
VGCHKNGFLFYQCMGDFLWGGYKLRAGCRTTPLQFFKRYGTLKNGHTWGYINFLVCMQIFHFLDIWMMFEFKFELWLFK